MLNVLPILHEISDELKAIGRRLFISALEIFGLWRQRNIMSKNFVNHFVYWVNEKKKKNGEKDEKMEKNKKKNVVCPNYYWYYYILW